MRLCFFCICVLHASEKSLLSTLACRQRNMRPLPLSTLAQYTFISSLHTAKPGRSPTSVDSVACSGWEPTRPPQSRMGSLSENRESDTSRGVCVCV
jgi:hypothetical protein